MSQQHPITPPPELVDQWVALWQDRETTIPYTMWFTQAARWGADMELRACCDTLQRHAHWDLAVFELMDDRRPKPPSLKEQALKELRQIPIDPELGVCASALDAIRRALEALPND